MHLAAGCVTMFFRVPLSCSKTLCVSELQDNVKICAGMSGYGGAVGFGKLLTHDQRCTKETYVQSIDTLLRVVLLNTRRSGLIVELLTMFGQYNYSRAARRARAARSDRIESRKGLEKNFLKDKHSPAGYWITSPDAP